ncbi:MAG: rhodanese-like domain-containing protein [Verrucomicrobiales bacterium]|nr:rhodanese-like domain-containing protein [Verrucomicrobiales bacterium]
MAQTAEQSISAETPMGEILELFPGAKRSLFARYHIGGCQSCSYSDDETLGEVCERNENLPVEEVIDHIYSANEEDRKILIDPEDLKSLLESGEKVRLIDLRTREEFEAVKLPDAEMFSNDLLQEIFGKENKERHIVLYDHTGDRCLDAAAYLLGHGFKNTRALRGGIDAYSQQADTSLPRYKVEFED